jgi:hypothetical protein
MTSGPASRGRGCDTITDGKRPEGAATGAPAGAKGPEIAVVQRRVSAAWMTGGTGPVAASSPETGSAARSWDGEDSALTGAATGKASGSETLLAGARTGSGMRGAAARGREMALWAARWVAAAPAAEQRAGSCAIENETVRRDQAAHG